MDTIHTDHLPENTLAQCRADARMLKITFIETKWCDVKDNRMFWTTELKLFRKTGIEKLWFNGRHANAPLFWIGKIPKAAA